MARWRGLLAEAAPRHVLLEGFHALKHALRFGAVVPVALCTDRAGTLELAAELAPDLGEVLARLLVEVDAQAVRALVPRPHPTGVAALA
ncbi:rRNA methyltransferase, partial [Streptomyces sp. SID8455]|nr:rRNA methyltransferase [Streptomyces sp. SID8455]